MLKYIAKEFSDEGLLNTFALKYCALLFCFWGTAVVGVHLYAEAALAAHELTSEEQNATISTELLSKMDEMMEVINNNHIVNQLLRRLDSENLKLRTLEEDLDRANRTIERLERSNLPIEEGIMEDRDDYMRRIQRVRGTINNLNTQLESFP